MIMHCLYGPYFQFKKPRNLLKTKIIHVAFFLQNGSMISNNITNDLTILGIKLMCVWVFCLSVIRGSFDGQFGSTKLVLCPESRRSACGRFFLCTQIVISILAIALVSLIIERYVVLQQEGPLREVPLYLHVPYGWKISCNSRFCLCLIQKISRVVVIPPSCIIFVSSATHEKREIKNASNFSTKCWPL